MWKYLFKGKFPEIEEKINQAQTSFKDILNLIVADEKAKLFNQLDAEFDKNGNLVSFDAERFKTWIYREFDKKNVPSNVYDYFIVQGNRFLAPLEGSPQRALIESVIASAISKRIVRPKLHGEPYIQVSSTGYSKKGTRAFKKPTRAQYQKYGIYFVMLRKKEKPVGKSFLLPAPLKT